MRKGLQMYFLVLLTLAVSSVIAFGQGSTGSLSGTVVDPKGAVVAGATVVVKNVGTNQENTTQTSGEGTFNVPSLVSGVYIATINAAGFKQAVVTDIKIDVGKPSSISIGLEIGSANESVTVVGGGELLQTQTATVGTTLVVRSQIYLPLHAMRLTWCWQCRAPRRLAGHASPPLMDCPRARSTSRSTASTCKTTCSNQTTGSSRMFAPEQMRSVK